MDYNTDHPSTFRICANYFIQMSGVPGTGKSTLARAIAPHWNAIVLDHDDTRSVIMATSIANDLAGQASYNVIKALARRYVSGDQTVIIDSPCLHIDLLRYGQTLAQEFKIPYRYIECPVDDLNVLNARLEGRLRKPSQIRSLNEPLQVRGEGPPRDAHEVFAEWDRDMQRPDGTFLITDSTRSIARCIDEAVTSVADGEVH